MVATAKITPAALDIRELITGTGPFCPAEIRGLTQALGGNAAAHRDVRAAVRELEQTADRSPASSVRLGVCQYLLGRYREALDTLRSADGGALALYHQGLAHVALETFDKAQEAFEAAKKSGYDAVVCGAAAADSLRAAGNLDQAHKAIDAMTAGNDSDAAHQSADYWAAKGAILADRGCPASEVAEAFASTGIEYFNTYGGNSVACAISEAVLDTIVKEDLQGNALRVGEYIQKKFQPLLEKYDWIGDVRGFGLFQGVEFVRSRASPDLQPYPELTKFVVDYLRYEGVIISRDGPDANVIKIKPPLVFSDVDADKLIATIDAALDVARSSGAF
jgi:tetratricopeptide (TPR) repeat protein